ncbi:hypothetical protein PanWU01x14_202450 [Parasponia andersonii]|uniref:Uncharacterized protein n=1 Tax=Parasponia andersonii TaxID=3476 RepID=A0A2P5BX51_PARAD|nr:hypothetical protein PanWU01x14_202450 [Parasponia andersonii]
MILHGFLDPNSHANLQKLHNQILIMKLLGEHGPSDHRPPSRDSIQRRVPPAMRQESPDSRVVQNRNLRCPTSEHKTSLFNPLFEILLFQPFLEPSRGIEVVFPDYPDERTVRRLQPNSQLLQLRI